MKKICLGKIFLGTMICFMISVMSMDTLKQRSWAQSNFTKDIEEALKTLKVSQYYVDEGYLVIKNCKNDSSKNSNKREFPKRSKKIDGEENK